MARNVALLVSNLFRNLGSKGNCNFYSRNVTTFQGRNSFAMTGFKAADPVQEASMDEECILVNEEDAVVGSASKRECHLVREDGSLLLHRAFSVFAFNSQGELLLQKRSQFKVTFPLLWANTCCSHPLHRDSELDGERGARRAAQRRLGLELGVPAHIADPSQMHFLTRVHYQANSPALADLPATWGEHEIDYILILRNLEASNILPNPNEVCETRYVARSQLSNFLREHEHQLTPWFSLIAHTLLPVWWEQLDSLQQINQKHLIHRF